MPANPNGSLHSIAGICSERRNVVGLMPHPERACESPLGSKDGLVLFESVRPLACRSRRRAFGLMMDEHRALVARIVLIGAVILAALGVLCWTGTLPVDAAPGASWRSHLVGVGR